MRGRTWGGNIPAQYLVYNVIHNVARGLQLVATDLGSPPTFCLNGRADTRLRGRAANAAVGAEGEALAVGMQATDAPETRFTTETLGAHVRAFVEHSITSTHLALIYPYVWFL